MSFKYINTALSILRECCKIIYTFTRNIVVFEENNRWIEWHVLSVYL